MASAFKLLFLILQNYRKKNPEDYSAPTCSSCGIILGDSNPRYNNEMEETIKKITIYIMSPKDDPVPTYSSYGIIQGNPDATYSRERGREGASENQN